MEVVRHAQALGAVPACPIQHEHDLLAWRRADRGGKGRQFRFEQWHAHGRCQVKDGAARRGMDEADEVAPVVAVLDGRQWTLAVETPHFVQDGFQPDAVFVDRPEFDVRRREVATSRRSGRSFF